MLGARRHLNQANRLRNTGAAINEWITPKELGQRYCSLHEQTSHARRGKGLGGSSPNRTAPLCDAAGDALA